MAIDQIVNTDMNGTTQMVFDILHPEGKPVIVSAIDGTAGSTEKPHQVNHWLSHSENGASNSGSIRHGHTKLEMPMHLAQRRLGCSLQLPG